MHTYHSKRKLSLVEDLECHVAGLVFNLKNDLSIVDVVIDPCSYDVILVLVLVSGDRSGQRQDFCFSV
jgi:hypothetical protein